MRFRNGKASSGAVNCTMLPGGARPAYAEFLTEEPANSPVTEDRCWTVRDAPGFRRAGTITHMDVDNVVMRRTG